MRVSRRCADCLQFANPMRLSWLYPASAACINMRFRKKKKRVKNILGPEDSGYRVRLVAGA